MGRPARGQRWADEVTQTSPEEVRRFRARTPRPPAASISQRRPMARRLGRAGPRAGQSRASEAGPRLQLCPGEPGAKLGWGTRLDAPDLATSCPPCSAAGPGGPRALVPASHFPFSLPRQMFFQPH